MSGPAVVATSLWTVKDGQVDAFVERWSALAHHALSAGVARRFVLLEDRTHARRFVSFGEWTDRSTMTTYRTRAAFRAAFLACRALCEAFGGEDLDVAAQVGAAGPFD
jgi:quinol monooxygenase YgiN